MKKFVNVVFNVSTIGAFTNSDKEYVFACFDYVDKGDVVVVDTRYGFQLATVTQIMDTIPENRLKGLKDVVCRVDFTKFNIRKERAAKLAEVKQEMDKRVKELQASAIYEMMAEKDPALAQMLKVYKGMQEEE